MKISKDEIQNSPGYFKHMKDSRINTPESRRCMEASQICICYYIFRAVEVVSTRICIKIDNKLQTFSSVDNIVKCQDLEQSS